MSITIEKAKLKSVSIGLNTAGLRFSTAEKQVLPDAVRDSLSMLERMENLVTLRMASPEGEIMLELVPCRVTTAVIKIGPGRGMLSFATSAVEQVWGAREWLRNQLLSDMETVTVVIVEQQPGLFQFQPPSGSPQGGGRELAVEPTEPGDWVSGEDE